MKLHNAVISYAAVADKAHFNVYLNEECARIAKYLYAHAGVQPSYHLTDVCIGVPEFVFVTDTLGHVYKTENVYYECVAMNIEKDIEDILYVYHSTVIQPTRNVWKDPGDDDAMLRRPFAIADMSMHTYVFYNYQINDTITVDGACPDFLDLVVATEYFPVHDWKFVGTLPKHIV